jgi:hypothetical protein
MLIIIIDSKHQTKLQFQIPSPKRSASFQPPGESEQRPKNKKTNDTTIIFKTLISNQAFLGLLLAVLGSQAFCDYLPEPWRRR